MMSETPQISADVVSLPLRKRGVPGHDELGNIWCNLSGRMRATFIEAAKLPPLTKKEYVDLSFELSRCTYWHQAVAVVAKWRERKLGGPDEVARYLEDRLSPSFTDVHEVADMVRRLVAEEHAKKPKPKPKRRSKAQIVT